MNKLHGSAAIFLSILLVVIIQGYHSAVPIDQAIHLASHEAASSIAPITFKYRGGDVSADGGTLSPSAPENPLDLYSVFAAACIVTVVGILSTFLLVIWNKRQKLHRVLKDLRESQREF